VCFLLLTGVSLEYKRNIRAPATSNSPQQGDEMSSCSLGRSGTSGHPQLLFITNTRLGRTMPFVQFYRKP
jgi:hypothetical protein